MNLVMKKFVDDHEGDASEQLATGRIKSITFGVTKASDVLDSSFMEVVNRNLYGMGSSTPTPYGALDRRLGTASKKHNCETCNKPLVDCLGHFGHISLELPVFHIGLFKETVRVLQCCCKTCGRVLLSGDLRERYLNLMTSDKLDRHHKKIMHEKAIIRDCKKVRVCPYCTSHNGTVKKPIGVFRVVHELRHKESQGVREEFLSEFNDAVDFNPQLKEYVSKAHEDITALTVLRLFKKIPACDLPLLFLDTKGRPEDMIITELIVPPICIRPSVSMGYGGSNEDDLTVKLGDIVYINKFIGKAIEKGDATAVIIENWEFLQQQVAMYINSDLPGFPKIRGNIKKIRALTQRLKGKQGRFRGNLSGKRVNFSGRTVISPDPNLRVDQVGIPKRIAKIMTYPEMVNAHNIERLREAVLKGSEEWPGANFLEMANGHKMSLKYAKRDLLAASLKHGDIVERHLRDGEIILFNRQPSLHRVSIMAHQAKVLDWRTFRFNECVCTPYNADFDGDEMNIHVPQTEEARTEALYLMGVENNLMTPRHGQPLVAANQDFLTAAYLLTNKEVFYTRDKISQICCHFNGATEHIVLPPPSIFKPMQLWTGKQVFSVMLRPNSDACHPLVNMELTEKHYTKGTGVMCPVDGMVVIRGSELLCGNLCKGTLGGSAHGLVSTLIRDYSPHEASVALNRLAKLSARWIGDRGFSVGIDDVTPSLRLQEQRRERFSIGYDDCKVQIDKFLDGKLEAQAGLTDEQTLEGLMVSKLSVIREDLGSSCLRELDYLHNGPLIMAVCGSKGSALNISQMVVGVGQQTVSSQRIAYGFVNRTLPHFPKFSLDPDARGFVENSFYSGLTATEFFFHTMGGREGLVDTAVKTAETGYMQRRLVKALEDLCVQYDGSVRTSDKCLVQMKYGDDGLDPIMMGGGMMVVDFEHSFRHTQALHPCKGEAMLSAEELRGLVAEEMVSDDKKNIEMSSRFQDSLNEFLEKRAKKLEDFTAYVTKSCEYTPQEVEMTVGMVHRVTKKQLMLFLDDARRRYAKAVIEPGTAVGAIAAQSIGEPGTQMTLKTFHFAGIATGVSVTQGVPRIKEIINASANIKCPVVYVPLINGHDLSAARIIKGRIERTTLGEVADSIEQILTPKECYVCIRLDMDRIKKLQLNITAPSVVRALLENKKCKLKGGVRCKGNEIRVLPPDGSREGMLYSLQTLCSLVPDVVVCGIATVARAVISRKTKDSPYEIQVEGSDILKVMSTTGVKGTQVVANHLIAVEKTLGIEAARATIMKEIHFTMSEHGLTVDPRHVALLADIMTCRGQVLGITRFGISKMKDSVLMLASFEKTADHLFDAALRGRVDAVEGVSECIITGTPTPLGTGIMQLLQTVTREAELEAPKPTLLSALSVKTSPVEYLS